MKIATECCNNKTISYIYYFDWIVNIEHFSIIFIQRPTTFNCHSFISMQISVSKVKNKAFCNNYKWTKYKSESVFNKKKIDVIFDQLMSQSIHWKQIKMVSSTRLLIFTILCTELKRYKKKDRLFREIILPF